MSQEGTTKPQNSFKGAEASALAPRMRGTNPFVLAAKQVDAAAPEHPKEDAGRKRAPRASANVQIDGEGHEESQFIESDTFVFVESDVVGPELPADDRKTKKLAKPRKESATGAVQKAPDLFVVHSKGASWFPASDGRQVAINLSKLMMLRLTVEQLELPKYKGKTDHNRVPLSVDHFECLCPSGDAKHLIFHLVKKNTGNVSKHAKEAHETVLEALARIIEETSAEEALQACKEYVQALSVGGGDELFRFWNIQDGDRITKETCALIWYIDGFIPFAQFDNPLFKQFCAHMSGGIEGTLSGTKTIMETVLPALYAFAMDENLKSMQNWLAFFNTFDGWSKFHRSFMSQNYHGIDSKTFEFKILLLDLIPFPAQKFRETIGAALITRQQYWTDKLGDGVIAAGGLDSWAKPIAAGGLADQASNVQDAGDFVWGEDDMSKCQCHVIGRVYVDMEKGAHVYLADYTVMALMCSFIAANGNIMKSLHRYQVAHALAELHVILANDTRWSGRYKAINRVIELAESIVALLEVPEVKALQVRVPDFLSEEYFTRLRGYRVLLKELNDVTTFYETQRFPVGCFVPLLTIYLLDKFAPSVMDPPYVVELKREVFASLERRMSCLSEVNNFLLAALLHPGVCGFLLTSKRVSASLMDTAFEKIVSQAELIDADATELVRAALGLYRKKHLPTGVVPSIDISEISKDGLFWGCNHMVLWKSIANGSHSKASQLQAIVPVGSMLLAVPASEAVDEFTFSSSGQTLTKGRYCLSAMTIEQVTVLRMFIRNKGFSPIEFDKWRLQAVAKAAAREKMAKLAEK